jgi:hypothetical protein
MFPWVSDSRDGPGTDLRITEATPHLRQRPIRQLCIARAGWVDSRETDEAEAITFVHDHENGERFAAIGVSLSPVEDCDDVAARDLELTGPPTGG